MRRIWWCIPLTVLLCACGGRQPRPTPVVPPHPIADERPSEPVRQATPPPIAPPPVTTHEEAPAAVPPVDLARTLSELNGRLRDAFFDYDQSGLRADALAALREDAEFLRPLLAQFPLVTVTIEGHCDERGSAEYNLGLGDRRARQAADALAELGVPAARANVISYGREAPQCVEQTESCHQRNRRAHLVVR